MRGDQLELLSEPLRKQLDEIATAGRKQAGLATEDYAGAMPVAKALVGQNCIVYEPRMSGPAYLRRLDTDRFEIVVRPGVRNIRFRIHHEVAHVLLLRAGMTFHSMDLEERAANYVAASVMAPADHVRRVHAHYGDDLRSLGAMAQVFGITQTSMQIRLHEVVGGDRAVVTSVHGRVLAYGARWAGVKIVRLARPHRPWRGPAKVRLPDGKEVFKMRLHGGVDEGRIALRMG